MDVHRCRFVPFQPSPINAIAVSRPNPRSSKHNATTRMAIGRKNGDIEIWNPIKGQWHQELIIRGAKDRSVEGLVWINEPDQDLGDGRVLLGKSRLFSIGYTSTVTEWDLEKGKPKRHASGQHGHIWCMAAQPVGISTSKDQDATTASKLVCGTIDGELVMYSTEDDDLRLQRVIVRSPTKKTTMVSITFQSRKIAIVGCSDSTIRAYDVSKGHMQRRMALGSDTVGGSKEIIVWAVQCLPNGNIVSGDSTGHLCIWDGRTYTQIQRIQSHKQDILSLALSADGTSILSGGMDRRTVLYRQNPDDGKRWARVSGRKYHEHDVKALASFEHGPVSVVISGGSDSNTIVVPLNEISRENHRSLPNLPQQPPVISAQKARFMLSWWDREIHIWLIRQPVRALIDQEDGTLNEDVNLNRNKKLLKTIVVRGESNISDATINAEGTLLVVSTPIGVKAFQLKHNDPQKSTDVKISTLELPQKLTEFGASHVLLSPDSSWLCTIQDGSRPLMARVDSSDDGDFSISPTTIRRLQRLKRQIPRHFQNGGLRKYERNITHLSFTPDSRMLAAADLAGYIDTWVLRNQQSTNGAGDQEEDSASDSDSSDSEGESEAAGTERWLQNPNGKLLPKLPSAPTVLTFSEDVPGKEVRDYSLLAVTRSWHIHVLNPLQGSLTPWSRRHPRKSLPNPVLDLMDIPKGAVWKGSQVWIYGISFLLKLDLNMDLPKHTAADGEESAVAQSGLKRKRTGRNTGAGGKMDKGNLKPNNITKYIDDEEEDIDMDDVRRSANDEDNDSDSDDDEDNDANNELVQLRNGNANGDEAASKGEVGEDSENKSWWMTLKFRPIFGVVPIGQGELAVVERPIWEIDMPEAYVV